MEKKIFVLNRKGKKLSVIIHTPSRKTSKIIILMHSFKGDKDYQPIMRNFSRKAEIEGYAVIRFDSFGSGESEGSFEESSITTQVQDLKYIIKFAKSNKYKDICLVGLSLGATISVLAYDKTIKCLVLWSPVFDHSHLYENYKNEMIKHGFIIRERNLTGEKVKVGRKMWKEFKSTNQVKKLRKIKTPTLAIIGTKDVRITPGKARKFMKMIPAKRKLEIIKGGDHDFLVKKAEERAISLSLDWIRKYL